ncbi:hypothetical protein B0T17DRAFT_510502 [Bombardia bombarda]|uniref:Uncharacterized protein n=1 Tax=Bombardia bombarda TaxID=252184 RepID=A0AA39WIE0_9PEZI|nr:hypothetical protein B0T17DRAFT_510502 [Bombardia bombarda]
MTSQRLSNAANAKDTPFRFSQLHIDRIVKSLLQTGRARAWARRGTYVTMSHPLLGRSRKFAVSPLTCPDAIVIATFANARSADTVATDSHRQWPGGDAGSLLGAWELGLTGVGSSGPRHGEGHLLATAGAMDSSNSNITKTTAMQYSVQLETGRQEQGAAAALLALLSAGDGQETGSRGGLCSSGSQERLLYEAVSRPGLTEGADEDGKSACSLGLQEQAAVTTSANDLPDTAAGSSLPRPSSPGLVTGWMEERNLRFDALLSSPGCGAI